MFLIGNQMVQGLHQKRAYIWKWSYVYHSYVSRWHATSGTAGRWQTSSVVPRLPRTQTKVRFVPPIVKIFGAVLVDVITQ